MIALVQQKTLWDSNLHFLSFTKIPSTLNKRLCWGVFNTTAQVLVCGITHFETGVVLPVTGCFGMAWQMIPLKIIPQGTFH